VNLQGGAGEAGRDGETGLPGNPGMPGTMGMPGPKGDSVSLPPVFNPGSWIELKNTTRY